MPMTVRLAPVLHLSAFALAIGAAVANAAPTGHDAPSRKAQKGCAWEQRTDATLGLQSWVQACDFGFRKIDFLVVKDSLAQRYSDGGEPEPVVDVFALQQGESAEEGLKRVFAAATDKAVAARCVLATFHGEGVKTPAGAKRYSFEPNAAYRKELARTQDPNEVGDPPCGPYGTSNDGIQYFETQPAGGARRGLFVRVGQDEPLFDENSLKLIPPAAPAAP
jgi:hypothetical protein